MNPYSVYIDCINCGNELSNISELTFRTPDVVVCDFCGQRYTGLAQRIKRRKRTAGLIFLLIAILIFWQGLLLAGFTTALFSLFPVLIIYYFTLGHLVKQIVKF